MTEFSQKIDELLNRHSEKPAVIARMAGISPDEISKYRRGDRFPMNSKRVDDLLSALRCSVIVYKDIKNAWYQEYMARKYKESDAWDCVKEVLDFLQGEGLASDICRCDKKNRFCPDGGVIHGKLDVRRYLEAFLNSKQECEIKIWGNEFFAEELSSISYSKETQYIHLLYSENTEKNSRWIHTICGMLSRMFSNLQYQPLLVYGNSGWTSQLFSGAIISQDEAVLISEDAEQGMVIREPAQIHMLAYYFARMREQGKPIVAPVKQSDWYRTADEDAIFVQSWLEIERVSKRKGTYYISTDAVKTFAKNGILWDYYKNNWYQYKSKSGKRNILESICSDSHVNFIDSDLAPQIDFMVAFCENRFLCISKADEATIKRYEVCEPMLVKWIGLTLKEMSFTGFVMDEQRKHQIISQIIEGER